MDKSVLINRNNKACKIFNLINIKIRLIDTVNPTFIVDSKYRIPVKLEGSNLVFRKVFNPYEEPFFTLDINTALEEINTEQLKRVFDQIEKVPVYIIFIKSECVSPTLYLIGFDKNFDNEINYPVFGVVRPKIFYNKEYAQKIVDRLTEQGFKVILQ